MVTSMKAGRARQSGVGGHLAKTQTNKHRNPDAGHQALRKKRDAKR